MFPHHSSLQGHFLLLFLFPSVVFYGELAAALGPHTSPSFTHMSMLRFSIVDGDEPAEPPMLWCLKACLSSSSFMSFLLFNTISYTECSKPEQQLLWPEESSILWNKWMDIMKWWLLLIWIPSTVCASEMALGAPDSVPQHDSWASLVFAGGDASSYEVFACRVLQLCSHKIVCKEIWVRHL